MGGIVELKFFQPHEPLPVFEGVELDRESVFVLPIERPEAADESLEPNTHVFEFDIARFELRLHKHFGFLLQALDALRREGNLVRRHLVPVEKLRGFIRLLERLEERAGRTEFGRGVDRVSLGQGLQGILYSLASGLISGCPLGQGGEFVCENPIVFGQLGGDLGQLINC